MIFINEVAQMVFNVIPTSAPFISAIKQQHWFRVYRNTLSNLAVTREESHS
jgi:hypothetical protein